MLVVAATLLVAIACAGPRDARAGDRPNIILIMADDLGFGDLGCYGQRVIATPRLDQMAAEGLRFRQFYAGSTVCAPSRSVLMTGQHAGRTRVRGNSGPDTQRLLAEDLTVAELLQQAGYKTALCGKWGLGDDAPQNTGLPNDQGFEFFYGYLNQTHAHNYYPEFLWRNKTREPLRNKVVPEKNDRKSFVGGYATQRLDYSHDLVVEEALQYIDRHHQDPFFLYLALTIPHINNEAEDGPFHGHEVPDYGIYAQESWEDADKGHAAMITRMDHDVGRVLDKLAAWNIDEQTIVMFTSDNGPHEEGQHTPDRFRPSGPLRGRKRDLYEGGIRVPLIVRWPNTTSAGAISNHIGYFGDLMATVAELCGEAMPPGVDSISFAPTITGRHDGQLEHLYLYWEFYERGGAQAVRAGKWKGVRQPIFSGELELYDLARDVGESDNLAAEHPSIVALMSEMMKRAHRPDPAWQPNGRPRQPPSPPGKGELPF